MNRAILGGLCALTVAGLAACSSSAPTGGAAAHPSASASSPAADGGTYPDADAVLAALQQAAVPCVDPSPVANPTAEGALSMTDCGSSAGDGDTVVVVFDSPAHTLAYAADLTSGAMSQLAPGALVVYGRNWAVNTSAGYAPVVQRALGGQLVTGPTPSPS